MQEGLGGFLSPSGSETCSGVGASIGSLLPAISATAHKLTLGRTPSATAMFQQHAHPCSLMWSSRSSSSMASHFLELLETRTVPAPHRVGWVERCSTSPRPRSYPRETQRPRTRMIVGSRKGSTQPTSVSRRFRDLCIVADEAILPPGRLDRRPGNCRSISIEPCAGGLHT